MLATSVLLLAVLGSPPQTATAGESISALQEKHSFASTPQQGLRGTNPATKLDFTIQSGGATTIQSGKVAITARLDRVGRGNVTQSVAGITPTLRQTTDANGWPMAQIQRPGVTEEYRNYQNAMRHYIHIAEKPTGNNGDLTVRVSLTGVDRVLGGGSSVIVQAKETTLHYENLVVWDANKRRLKAKVQPDGKGFRFTVQDQNAAYPITIDPDWVFRESVFHPYDSSNEWLQFGASNTTNGDILAVGAPRDYTDGSWELRPGSVHVYRREGAGWTYLQQLNGVTTGNDSHFGYGVSMSYDPTPGDTQGQILAVSTLGVIEFYRRAPGASTFTSSGFVPNYVARSSAMRLMGRKLVIGRSNTGTTGEVALITYSGGSWQVTSSFLGSAGQKLGQQIAFDGTHAVALGDGNTVELFQVSGNSLVHLSSQTFAQKPEAVAVSQGRVILGFPTAGRGEARLYRIESGALTHVVTHVNPYSDGPINDETTAYYSGFGARVQLNGGLAVISTWLRYSSPGDMYYTARLNHFDVTDTGMSSVLIWGTADNPQSAPQLINLESGRLTITRFTDDIEFGSTNYVSTYELQGLGLNFTPTSEVGGKNATGVITLSSPAPAGGDRVYLTSNNAALTVPAVVTVPEGATTVNFTASTTPVAQDTAVTVTGFSNTAGTGSASFEVRTPRVGSMTANFTEVGLGSTINLNVVLQAVAGPGGVVVNLTHDSGTHLTIPASVTIPQGQSRVTVPATVGNQFNGSAIKITATPSYREKSVTLTVRHRTVINQGGNRYMLPGSREIGFVTISDPAPASGQVVNISNSRPDLISIPSSVTVPAGQMSVDFDVVALYPSGSVSGDARTLASIRSATTGHTYICRQRFLVEVTVAPTVVVGGNSAVGSVRISHPAAPGGTVVMMKSLKPTLVMVPSSVTVPAGQITATFPVTTAARNSDTALVTTLIGNLPNLGTKGAKITVTRPSVTSVTLNPATVVGGNTSTGTVTLNGPAATGGILVTLASQKPTIAQVPATVLVPAGATSVNFTITTVPIASGSVKSTISARIGTDGTRGSALTVTAP